MKKLKSNRLSHLAEGERFPTDSQKRAREETDKHGGRVLKSAGIWVCEDCDKQVQADYAELSASGTPVCLECEETMSFDHEVFFNA